MTLKYTSTKEIYLAFYNDYFKSSKTLKKSIIWTQLFIFFMLILNLIFIPPEDLIGLFFMLVIAIAFCLWIPRSLLKSANKKVIELISSEAHQKFYGPCEVEIESTGLKMISPVGESKINWLGIEKWSRNKEYIFIQFGNTSGLAIPIAEVGKETSEKFYQLLEEKIRQ